jgi:formamidopyrimidine-DNA glycosylase
LRLKIPKNFESFLKNQKIENVKRFSKYLIFNLSNKSHFLLHLGMSGTIHLVYYNHKNLITNASFYSSLELPKKHNHVEIFFKKLKIVYNDPRRFGFIQIIKNDTLLKKRFNCLGPEPFDKKFDQEYIYLFFKKKLKNIKDFLLDQQFVSGIGNIYANEILFFSKINPAKKAKLLDKKDCKKLVSNARRVLIDAINKGGSSIRDFKSISGVKGNFQKNFKVYQREGLKCKRPKCIGIIQRKNISNRSSFFCNICQK